MMNTKRLERYNQLFLRQDKRIYVKWVNIENSRDSVTLDMTTPKHCRSRIVNLQQVLESIQCHFGEDVKLIKQGHKLILVIPVKSEEIPLMTIRILSLTISSLLAEMYTMFDTEE